ncbi:hypothetical protein NKG05_12145 [Oerskovia sp. M15]
MPAAGGIVASAPRGVTQHGHEYAGTAAEHHRLRPTASRHARRRLGRPDLPADPRSTRWDRSVGTLSRLLDELAGLDEGELAAAR